MSINVHAKSPSQSPDRAESRGDKPQTVPSDEDLQQATVGSADARRDHFNDVASRANASLLKRLSDHVADANPRDLPALGAAIATRARLETRAEFVKAEVRDADPVKLPAVAPVLDSLRPNGTLYAQAADAVADTPFATAAQPRLLLPSLDGTRLFLAQAAGTDQRAAQREADRLIQAAATEPTATDRLRALDMVGARPAVIQAVLADTRVEAWVREASAAATAPYVGVTDPAIANVEAAATAEALAATVEGMAPQLAQAVVSQSMPTVERLAQAEMVYGGGFGSMQRVVDALGDDSGAEALTRRIADAFAPQAERWSGLFFQTARNTAAIGEAPTLTLAIADAIGQAGSGDEAQAIRHAVALGLTTYLETGPMAAVKQADQAVDEKNQRLAELLATAGPLSDQQRQAFAQAYMADPANASVYEAQAAAGRELATYVEANQATLLALAANDPALAAALGRSVEALSSAGQGTAAVELLTDIGASADVRANIGNFDALQAEASAAAATQLLLENNGNAAAAAQAFVALVEPLYDGVDGWAGVREGLLEIAQSTRPVDAQALAGELAAMGRIGHGLAVAGVAFGLFNAAQGESPLALLEAYTGLADDGTGLALDLLAQLADTGRLAAFADDGVAIAGFASRIVPVLSLVANSAAFAASIERAQESPVYVGSVIGNAFAVFGSVVSTIPGGQGVGSVVSGVGTLVAAAFDLAGAWTDGIRDREQLLADTRRYLEIVAGGPTGAGLTPQVIAAIVGTDPEQVSALLATGMTAREAQELAVAEPQLLMSPHGQGFVLDELQGFQQRAGLSGSDLAALFRASDAPPGSMVYLLAALGTNSHWDIRYFAQTRSDIIAELRSAAADTSNAGQAATFTAAADWLQTHVPTSPTP